VNEADRDLGERWLTNIRARRSKADSTDAQSRSTDQTQAVHDVDDDVLAILIDDSDPGRGWNLAMHLLESARDDYERRRVGIEALETLFRESGDKLADAFQASIRRDDRLREAVKHIFLSGKVAEIARAEGLYPPP
jgi:hypothetical protein